MNILNIPEFSVSEFSKSIKLVVEDAFGYVRIKGEITGFRPHSSGHFYFSLQENEYVISAICFKNLANLINFKVENGLEVVASGRITTYGNRSNYQIVVEKLEIAGIGAILEMIEKRRQKLHKEGIFDEIHKKSLPVFPKKIGVITSKTGSVIEDIKHRINDRFPLHLVVYNAAMQGNKVIDDVISGIKYFNNLHDNQKPDIIIIARGGGSFEDLLPFNDEQIVRAVFDSQIAIISAIGHETDITLIDYVADVRAPTPTAAAEIATPILQDMKLAINNLAKNLNIFSRSLLSDMLSDLNKKFCLLTSPKRHLDNISDKMEYFFDKITTIIMTKFDQDNKKLNFLTMPKNILINKIEHDSIININLYEKINSNCQEVLFRKEKDLLSSYKLLQNNNYKNVLNRGFALIKNNDKIISLASQISPSSIIDIEFSDGNISAKVINKNDILYQFPPKKP